MKTTGILYLSQPDIVGLKLTPGDILAFLRTFFAQAGISTAVVPNKSHLHIPGKEAPYIIAMPAYLKTLQIAGVKWAGVSPSNPSRFGVPAVTATIVLNDPENATPLAFLDGTWITAHRTGAVTALAASYLVREGPEVLAIIGTGVQARGHLLFLNEVMKIDHVVAFDTNPATRDAYIGEMTKKIGIPIRPADSPEEAVKQAQVVMSCTSGRQPYLLASWLGKVKLVMSIARLELDRSVVTSWADRIYVDDLEANKEFGSLSPFFQDGTISERQIGGSLSQLVGEEKKGRQNESERLLFHNAGMSCIDIALAAHLWRLAEGKNVGTKLPYQLDVSI